MYPAERLFAIELDVCDQDCNTRPIIKLLFFHLWVISTKFSPPVSTYFMYILTFQASKHFDTKKFWC